MSSTVVRIIIGALVIILLATGLALLLVRSGTFQSAGPTPQHDDDGRIATALYETRLTVHQLPDSLLDLVGPRSDGLVTQVRALPDGQILVVASPQAFHFSPTFRDGEYDGTSFPDRETMEATRAVAATVTIDGEQLEVVDSQLLDGLQLVRDIEIDGDTIYLTNIKFDDGCVALELHRARLESAPLDTTDVELLFETEPCIDIDPLGLHMVGGRIALNDDLLYLSVGELNMFGSFQTEDIPTPRPELLRPPSHYGTVIELAPDTGDHRIIASGLRNPQGLTYHDGDLWASDHGPGGGGDELNLVQDGADFGWPDVSYGIPYGSPRPSGDWDDSRFGGGHAEFEQPRLAWSPAIAPSELLVYDGAEFPAWNGDLMVSTLRDLSIRRVRMDGDRPVLDERIDTGLRARDISLDDQGRILIVTQAGQLAVLELQSDS